MKPWRPEGHSLAVTITIALIVKVAILYGIHKAFFSEPQAQHMRMPTDKVEQHLIATPAAPLNEPTVKGQ